jgi:hypothetical protein
VKLIDMMRKLRMVEAGGGGVVQVGHVHILREPTM